MKTTLACIPCLLRQTLEASRLATSIAADQQTIMREVLKMLSQIDLTLSPPHIAQQIYQRIRALSGVEDPYRALKQRFTQMALEILPELARKVDTAPEPLAMAARLAIAGNIIDLGAAPDLTESDVRLAIDSVLSEPFFGDLNRFEEAVSKAQHILFLADNAGEIVIDRLLIERLQGKPVTLAVRGRATINDATLEDAQMAGIHELCEVINNGSGAPGTILEACSQRFRQAFYAADLIISKGQGNYETLSDVPANIYFLFKVKCQVIASQIGLEVGTHALVHRPTP